MTQRDPSSASIQHPVPPGAGGAVVRYCIPRLPLRAPRAPSTGPGEHQSWPRGALCPDVSSQQVLVTAWRGQASDVTEGREGSHQASSKTLAPALSSHPGHPAPYTRDRPGASTPTSLRRHCKGCPVRPSHHLQDRLVWSFVRGNGADQGGSWEVGALRNLRLNNGRGGGRLWGDRGGTVPSTTLTLGCPSAVVWRKSVREAHQSWASQSCPPFTAWPSVHPTFYTQTLGVEGKYLAHVTLETTAQQSSFNSLATPPPLPLWTFSLAMK